jgi:hypothetical protein
LVGFGVGSESDKGLLENDDGVLGEAGLSEGDLVRDEEVMILEFRVI